MPMEYDDLFSGLDCWSQSCTCLLQIDSNFGAVVANQLFNASASTSTIVLFQINTPSFVYNSFSAQLSVIIRRPLVTNVVAQPTAQIYILKFLIPDKMVTNFREYFVLLLHLWREIVH